MKKTEIALAFVLIGALLTWSETTWGQAATNPQATTQDKEAEPYDGYHVELVLSELEDGKKINARHYSLNLGLGTREDLKIGTKVPVEIKAGETTYIDVGTSIFCLLRQREQGLSLEAHADVSSFASHNSPPLLRQFTISGNTLVTIGKAFIVGSVDDPESNHRFELQATLTKLTP